MANYYELALAALKKLIGSGDTKPTDDEVSAALRGARAAAGGHAKADKAKEKAATEETPAIAAEDLIALQAGPAYEDTQEELRGAIRGQFPGYDVYLANTYDGSAVFGLYDNSPGGGYQPHFYAMDWTRDQTTGGITLANRTEVKVAPREYVPIAAGDDGTAHFYGVGQRIRLDDSAGGVALNPRQHLHRLSEHVIPHAASGVNIVLDREMGDKMIANFNNNVVRRAISLDEIHLSGKHGRSLAKLKTMYWGNESAEPDPAGDWLCGEWKYNKLGTELLSDEQYMYTSPEYALDYPDAESGQSYGPTLVNAAATNVPFLKGMKSFTGEPPAPVAALDGETITEGVPIVTTPAPAVQTVSLDDYNALKAQVAEAQRIALDAQRERRTDQIMGVVDSAIRAGAPAAIAHKLGKIMLSAEPNQTPTIALDDAAPEAVLNVEGAVRAILDELPRVLKHVASYGGGETRPASDTTQQLDAEYAKEGQRWAAAAHIGKANGASANGVIA